MGRTLDRNIGTLVVPWLDVSSCGLRFRCLTLFFFFGGGGGGGGGRGEDSVALQNCCFLSPGCPLAKVATIVFE